MSTNDSWQIPNLHLFPLISVIKKHITVNDDYKWLLYLSPREDPYLQLGLKSVLFNAYHTYQMSVEFPFHNPETEKLELNIK